MRVACGRGGDADADGHGFLTLTSQSIEDG
jgi:hypothetical protein